MFYRLMPMAYRAKVKEWLRYSGSKRTPQNFVNTVIAASIVFGIAVGFVSLPYFPLIFIGVFMSVFLLANGMLLLAIEKRTLFVEEILPDALDLIAANSRAGYIPSRAIVLSARKEFGPLSEGIKHIGREMLTGKSLEESLSVINNYIKSDTVDKTFKLINEGMRSGGQFAALLVENAHDIRRKQTIKKEVRANIMMYVIFISFAGVIGAPVLYALSGFLINTITLLSAAADVDSSLVSTQLSFLQISQIGITPETLFLFSIGAILITTVFGGLMVGLISTGRERGGIKYIPVFVGISMTIFFIARVVIENMFGNLL